MDTDVKYSDSDDNNYVKMLDVNVDINTDIEIDLYNDKLTTQKVADILKNVNNEIKKILILDDFPPYYSLMMEEHKCEKYSRNDSIEYMDNEEMPLVGCIVTISSLYLGSHKPVKSGVIVRVNNESSVDIKLIEYYDYNGEIILYDLLKDKYELQEDLSNELKVNNDGSITFDRSSIKIINKCLPRTLEDNEKRFIISSTPTTRTPFNKLLDEDKYISDFRIQLNVPHYYVLDKKLNGQYILNCVDIFELLKEYNEMIPFFEKYEDLNSQRYNPSERNKQLKNALLFLLKKRDNLSHLIKRIPLMKIEEARSHRSSTRTQKLKEKVCQSVL